MNKIEIDENGYYGNYGGAYIPEMLYPNVKELQSQYLKIMYEPSFQKEFQYLLKDYVGRPSPLYFAERLSDQLSSTIYLNREDLNHTGAHHINNGLGQVLLAHRRGETRILAASGA
ncbi:MAG: tryptophan synthase subunit beta, partial [Arachidicoccus sp.]